jgi:general secretion pathway protein J
VRARPAHAERGFTLLELLVALGILGLLTSTLLAAFRLEAEHISRRSAKLERASLLPVAHSFLRTQLANARPIVPIEATDLRIAFDGSLHGLRFIGAAPESVAGSGLLAYLVEHDGDQLRLRWQGFEGALTGDQSTSGESVLLENVASVAIHYYGAPAPQTPPQWHENWTGLAYLPSLIRIELVFSDGEVMPDFVVATRLAPKQQPGAEPTIAPNVITR